MGILSITTVPETADRQTLRDAVTRNEREIRGLRLGLSTTTAAGRREETAERIRHLRVVNRAYSRILKIGEPRRPVSIPEDTFEMNTL